MTCDKGHVTYTVLQQMRFEVLFEIGAHAIHDSYFREAISSFASATERFLEFYIQVVCRHNKLDPKLISDAWKPISRMSERQLGAYMFLYLNTERAIAPYLPDKMVTLRNDVVHQGKIPTRDHAVAFGNAVLAFINPVLRMLRERYPEVIKAMVFERIAEARAGVTGVPMTTSCIQTILSVMQNSDDVHDLREWTPPLEYFKKSLGL